MQLACGFEENTARKILNAPQSYLKAAAQTAINKVKRIERKVHAEGCLHSNNPEVIIYQGNLDDKDNGKMVTRGRKQMLAKGKLASVLFFKRCDETFKNIKGDVLQVGV